MSSFAKLSSIISIATIIFYLFTYSTFFSFNQTHKSINHDKLVKYILKEVTYEITYGDKNIDIEAFVDNALKEALLKK